MRTDTDVEDTAGKANNTEEVGKNTYFTPKTDETKCEGKAWS